MDTSKSNRKTRKMTGSKSSGFEVRVDNKRNHESMRAQKMDNDSEVYSEWPAQQRTKITSEGVS